MTPLAARMATLKANSNQSSRSDCKQPAPLSLFLAIYTKSEHECYIDYMEGARCLHSWLTSNGTIPLDLGPDLDPEFKVPRLLSSYEAQELTHIIVPKLAYNLDLGARVHRAIYFTLTTHH